MRNNLALITFLGFVLTIAVGIIALQVTKYSSTLSIILFAIEVGVGMFSLAGLTLLKEDGFFKKFETTEV